MAVTRVLSYLPNTRTDVSTNAAGRAAISGMKHTAPDRSAVDGAVAVADDDEAAAISVTYMENN